MHEVYTQWLTSDNTSCAIVRQSSKGSGALLALRVHSTHSDLVGHHQDGLTTHHWLTGLGLGHTLIRALCTTTTHTCVYMVSLEISTLFCWNYYM